LGAAERRAELRLHQALRGTESLVHGRDDHVREHLGVVGVDRLWIDCDLLDLAAAGRDHLDHPAARGRLDGLVLQLVLRLLHLLLHLLHLLEHLVHVHPHPTHSSTSRASKIPFISSMISSSLAGCSSSVSGPVTSPPFSPTSKARSRRRPVTS